MAYGVVIGMGLGYCYAQSRNNKAESKPCKCHDAPSTSQMERIARFSWQAGRIITIVPYVPYRIGMVAYSALFPTAGMLISLPEDSKQLAICMKSLGYVVQASVPEGIDSSRVTLLVYFFENYSKIANVGVLAGAVALPYFGYSAFAARIALPAVYGAVAANVVPTSVSRLLVSNLVSIAMSTGGVICTQIYSFIALPRGVSERTDDFLKKIGTLLLNPLKKSSSVPEEIEMRCMQPGVLSIVEINFILENDDKAAYEINLANTLKCVQAGFLGGSEDITARCSLILSCIVTKPGEVHGGKRSIFTQVSIEDRDRFFTYMSQEISTFINITMDQQENLVDRLNRYSEFPGILEGYLRLFFVMQDVLKIRPIGRDWDVIAGSMLDELGFTEVVDERFEDWAVIDRKV
jgi:hypothetical protein